LQVNAFAVFVVISMVVEGLGGMSHDCLPWHLVDVGIVLSLVSLDGTNVENCRVKDWHGIYVTECFTGLLDHLVVLLKPICHVKAHIAISGLGTGHIQWLWMNQ